MGAGRLSGHGGQSRSARAFIESASIEKISHLCVDSLAAGLDNARLESAEGYSSGQRGQTVNLLAYAYVGSNPTPSTSLQRWSAVGKSMAGTARALVVRPAQEGTQYRDSKIRTVLGRRTVRIFLRHIKPAQEVHQRNAMQKVLRGRTKAQFKNAGVVQR